jgi:cytochrome c biogenesis protein
MSNTMRTRPGDPGHDEWVDALDSMDAPTVHPTELFGRVWHTLTSMKFGLALILGLGLLSLIGTLLPQAPAGLASDPEAYASWLDSMRPRYGGWTNVLSMLGMFTVFTSLVFKVIVALLATSIIACSINRAPRLWKHAVHPRTTMGESFFNSASLHDSIPVAQEPEAALESARQVFRHHHFRTITGTADDGTFTLYADRYRWGPCGTVVAHLSFVVILLGFVTTTVVGFKSDEFTVPVGTKVAVEHGKNLEIEAASFNDVYYDDGSPADYASELVLYKDGVEVQRDMVRVNQPMRYDGISFFQSFFGVAASIVVRDASGATVYQGGVPLSWKSDDGTHSIGQLSLPEQKVTVFVIAPASGQVDPKIKAGQIQLEIYPSGADTPSSVEVLSQGKAADIDGLSYTFERTRRFTGLIVSRDPGAALVWIGSTMLVAGIVLVFFFPHRRVWVRVHRTETGSEVQCASILRRDLAFESQFLTIVHQIALAGTPADTTRR